jgi:two-component system chemotaxis response regulator CheB
MIRVLVADDSPTSRLLLTRILDADPQITVVGEAADGHEAVRLTHRLRPDLVTMDVEMPRMDGLEATQEIMSTVPTPIVIVTANPRAGEVETTMTMLRLGALEVLIKPAGPESPAFAETARRLVATVKALSQVKVIRHWRPSPPPRPSRRGGGPRGACGVGSWPWPPRPAGPRPCNASWRGCPARSRRRSWWSSTSARASRPAWPPGWAPSAPSA